MTIEIPFHSAYLDAIRQKIIVFDGAMGTSLQKMNLTAEQYGGERTSGCNDFLVISYPAAVEAVHRSYLEVGVDVIETCTFRANRLTLAEYGLQDRTREINLAAARLARKVADEFTQTTGQKRFVAGSIGPSGKLPSMNDPELSNITFNELAEIFQQQAEALIEGGVDLLLIETSQDILEVKAVVAGLNSAFEVLGRRLPIQAQVTLDTTGRMLLGTDISAVHAILEGLRIDAIGLNCSTGPEHMRQAVQYLGQHSSLPISCIPNAGLPLNIDGQAVYPMQPEPFANDLAEFVQHDHVAIVGGCCGTTPAHMARLVEAVKFLKPSRVEVQRGAFLSSSVQAVAMHQEPRPFLIGERLNTQGSAKFKKIVLAEDFESALGIAQQQVDSGAHALDLCVALTERGDEPVLLRRLIKTLAPTVYAPFVIDSTEPDVIETGLQNTPGRCLINSINLEAGPAKARKVLALARKYNAAVIALTIDEQGMARTAERKLEIARRIYDLVVNEFGMQPGDIVFDALTFTLATGEPEYAASALETFEGIRRIKAVLPGVLTSLGVSNVSFGLSPASRSVLNSVMLYHAVQAGLDMAIVNPAQITPYADIPAVERELAEDLIFNRSTEALPRLIKYFQHAKTSETQVDQHTAELAALQPKERIHWRIVHREKDGIAADLDEYLTQSDPTPRSQSAIEALNNVLLPAMKEVGDRFGAGELILPFVLQSAEVMKKAVAHLEQYLDRAEGVHKGRMVLATVYGDVHDIGKNLVKTILSNNGFEVIDLGKQVPAETIIEKAVEYKADAIGLSALLVSTSRQMPLIVNELQRRGLQIPVLIGGAAINRRFGRRIAHTENGQYFEPGVVYCKDAFEGLSAMEAIMDANQRPVFLERLRAESEFEVNKPSGSVPEKNHKVSSIPVATIIPRPPTWGPRVVHSMPLEEVFTCLSKNELFRLSWGAKNTHGADWEKLQQDYELRLEQMQRAALKENWLQPKGVYGYWPAQSEGDELIIYEPASVESGAPEELTRMNFPRQNGLENLCLADYFASRASGIMDTVAFQVVTVGSTASKRVEELQQSGDYTESYFTHGLAVQTAEAAAEFLHRHIRRELGLPAEQGKRYSWGYPAIPDLADHQTVFQLLPAESELGMKLSAAFQLIPEQSTAAIVIHHPAAKYYIVP